MEIVRFIAIHHSGPPAGFNYTSQNIEDYHKRRWNMPSTLGRYGGYNVSIDPQGKVFQHRAIGEETIGAKNYNFNTVHIALIGNFSQDLPTWYQRTALKNILVGLLAGKTSGLKVIPGTVLNIKASRIHPHRYFTKTTVCYGSKLSDDLGLELVKDYISNLRHMLITLRNMYLKMLQLRKLGGSRSECNLEKG